MTSWFAEAARPRMLDSYTSLRICPHSKILAMVCVTRAMHSALKVISLEFSQDDDGQVQVDSCTLLMTAFRPLSLAPFTRTTIYRSTTQLLNLVTAYRVTSTRHFHTPSLSRWLGRGRMRRTIGAWADSLGVTGHTDARSEEKDPREHEELFVMPGWAVVRYRESGQSDAPRESTHRSH